VRPVAVFLMQADQREDYPRLLIGHPRNRGVSWLDLDNYIASGRPGEMSFELFVKAKRNFDTVWISGRLAFSDRLRELIESTAGGPTEFLPVGVNGRPFWALRLSNIVDALDLEHSRYVPSIDGGIRRIEEPVWLGDQLSDPCLFSIPQLPETIWATDGFVRAYESSGCDGVLFGWRTEVS
jgi:hypothetical protein